MAALDDGWIRREPSPWPARLLAAVVALIVTGPALGPGFVLLRDMVFVPRQDLDLDALGLGGALPRAVPVDSAMALVTAVVPGELVQKAVLLGIVYAAVLGAARLVPPDADGRRGLAGVVAGVVYGWSPFVAERLLMGHWTHLLGYAALPWIARAALGVRSGSPQSLPRLVLVCVPAALSSTGALLAAGVIVALVGRPRMLPALGGLLVLALPWIVAGALHPGAGASDPAGIAAFAARGEGWGGVLVSLLGTGGIWNAEAVPPSRESVLLPVVTLALLALAGAGWWSHLTSRPDGGPHGPGLRLLLLGAVGLLVAVAGALPWIAGLMELAIEVLPGAGILRDGHKWIAWWALPLALGAGLGARRLAAGARARGDAVLASSVGVVAVLLPLIAVPDLVWGVGGRLQPVAYPDDWQQVRDVLATDPGPGDVLVLPFGAYRAFDWNADRPQLDPAGRWLSRPTITDDELVVGGSVVAGEDARAREVAAAADDPRELARLGVGWVLVERGTPGRPVPDGVRSLPLVVDGEELALHRVPGARPGPAPSPGRVTAVVVAHACALGIAGGALLWITAGASTVALRRRRPRKRVPE